MSNRVSHAGGVWAAGIFCSEDVLAGPFRVRINYGMFKRCFYAVNNVFMRKNGVVLTVIFGAFVAWVVFLHLHGQSLGWIEIFAFIGLAMGVVSVVHPLIFRIERAAPRFFQVHGVDSSDTWRESTTVDVRVVREGAEEIGAGGGLTRLPFAKMCSWPRVYGGMVVLAPYDRSRDSLWYSIVHGNQYYLARTAWNCTGIVVPWSQLKHPWRFLLDMHRRAVASRGVVMEHGVRRPILPVDEWMREAIRFNNAGLLGNKESDEPH